MIWGCKEGGKERKSWCFGINSIREQYHKRGKYNREEKRKKSEKGKGGKTNKANMPQYSKHSIFLLINFISFISFEYIEQKYTHTHTSSIRTPNLSSKLKT